MTPATRRALRRILDTLHRPLPDGQLPLRAGGEAIGALAPPFAARVLAAAGPIERDGADGLRIASGLHGEALSKAWRAQLEALRAEGWFRAWRDEDYDVRLGAADGQAPRLCRLERGAFRRYGLRSRAVHVNALTPDGRMWIARRAASKAVDPGRLDNLVGGGMASGEAPADTLLRECAEEAGIPAELAAQARPTATLHACRMEDDGIHDEWLHVWRLDVPESFEPRNCDGEVAEFHCVSADELAGRILAGEFTEDAAAVAVTWLLERVE
ncbi:NUDIX domain-containing protein [Pseudothauera nasutitermitis]|uniref:NUDIX domain-containing protein n=1 Tax=Pseudothauera nasutitermitis TaxID=2565930 RepID=A0A4S4B0J7_9RHOO|nr:NUDIX domain-containing protein [Pseudothauera nasutitermitis]THF65532.1 NUDIX domain-containing protein [Pseudothauera nasutitermitis]